MQMMELLHYNGLQTLQVGIKSLFNYKMEGHGTLKRLDTVMITITWTFNMLSKERTLERITHFINLLFFLWSTLSEVIT